MIVNGSEIEVLRNYYKRVQICEACKKPFGSDTKKWHLFCPKCMREANKRSNSKVKIKV